MRYRVRVDGPSVENPFGSDAYAIASPASVIDRDGVLIILLPPQPARPAVGQRRSTKATRSTQVIYPRGGWTKVTIIEFEEDPS